MTLFEGALLYSALIGAFVWGCILLFRQDEPTERISTVTIPTNPNINYALAQQSLLAQAKYQQAGLQHAGIYGQTANVTSNVTSNVVYSNGTATAGNGNTYAIIPGTQLGGQLGGVGQYNQGLQWQNQMTMPVPTGVVSIVTIIDAHGADHAITIDSAYYHIIQSINSSHQSHLQMYQGRKPAPMLDGDFSLDEMDTAEKVIEELSGAQA